MDNGREDKNPWVKWFWSDWLADNGLRLCGLAAKGLWTELLAYMSRSERKGYLVLNGLPMNNKDISKLVGEPEPAVATLMEELGSKGVYSQTSEGLIYNRRMARESNIQEARSKAGRKGMEKRWGHNKPHNDPITRVHNKRITRSASASVINSNTPNNHPQKEGECEGEKKPDPNDVRLTQLLADLIINNNPKSNVQRMSARGQAQWIRECRLMREVDKRSHEDIEVVIRWTQQDSFWMYNALSMKTIREKFDRFYMKATVLTGRQQKLSGIAEWLKDEEGKDEA